MLSFILWIIVIALLVKVLSLNNHNNDDVSSSSSSLSRTSPTRSPTLGLISSQPVLRSGTSSQGGIVDQLGQRIQQEMKRQRDWLQNSRVNKMIASKSPSLKQRGLFDNYHEEDESIIVPPEDSNGSIMVGTIMVPGMNQTTLYSLGPNAVLAPGQSLRSRNDIYSLEFRENGVLALLEYKAKKPIWTTNILNDYSFFIMEESGSFVQYVGDANRASSHGRELWSTHSTEYTTMDGFIGQQGGYSSLSSTKDVLTNSSIWVYATVLDIGVFVIFSYDFATKRWKILWHTPDPAHPSTTQQIMNSLDDWVKMFTK